MSFRSAGFSLVSGALLLFIIGAVLGGCGSESDSSRPTTRHEDVRGRFMGTASDGRDAVVHHEAIPDVMPAMIMSLPVADTSETSNLGKGAPIQFDLVTVGSNIRIENVRALPDTTTLKLGGPGTPGEESDTTVIPDGAPSEK